MVIKKPPDKIWYPTLLQAANNIKTNAWFDMNEIKNPKPNSKKNMVKLTKDKTIKYLQTTKTPIYPNEKQKTILHKWFGAVQEVYNITNAYLKKNTNQDLLDIRTLRSLLNDKLHSIQKTNNINKHTLDYSVSHCIAMYKSAYTNLERGYIKEFDIKDLSIDKNRYNLVIEPQSFSKKINGIFTTTLGHMNSKRSLKNIFKHNCILQYQKNTNRYFIIAPQDKQITFSKGTERYKKCGVDLGIRTFATIYTPEKVIEISNNTNQVMDRYLKKIDNINSQKDRNILKETMYNKILKRYGNKIRNRVNDIHKKVAVFLTSNFKEINLGKFSTKSMISNTTSNLKDIVKRRAQTLSFFKFNEFIQIMAKKYDCKVNVLDEYKTSMTCHSCKNENKNVGSSKIYNCVNKQCKIKLGRDVNAAINIYNGGFLRAKKPLTPFLAPSTKTQETDISYDFICKEHYQEISSFK